MELSYKQRWELGLLVVLSVVVAAAAVTAGRFDLVSANRAGVMYDTSYSQAAFPRGANEWIEGDWEVKREGLTLAAGQSGTLTIRVENDHEGRLVAFLYGRANRGLHSYVMVSEDGHIFREVARDVSLDAERVHLTSSVGHGEVTWFRLQWDIDQTFPVGAPATLSRIRLVVLGPPFTIPNLPIASLLLMAPVMAYVLRSLIRPNGALPYGLAVLCGLAILTEALAGSRLAADPQRWWELVILSREQTGYFMIPYVVLLALLGWHARVGRGSSPLERALPFFALGGVLAWGGSIRLEALAEVAWSRLDPDVINYMMLAEGMSSPYDTGSREPLWVWVIKGWVGLVGNSSLNLRYLTVILSLLLLILAYKLFRDYTGSALLGILVAWLLSVNPYLVSLSLRGLREEAYLISILCLFYFVFVQNGKMSFRNQAVGLALSGAAAQLLRFNSYMFVLPLWVVWAWRQGAGRVKACTLSLAFIIIVSVPHLVHNYQQFGDPLYSMNVHFVWARNIEFVMVKDLGCEGCPTREEMQVNSTPGPSLGAFEYLFGLHSVQEVMSRTAQGYLDLYLRPTDLFETQTGTQSRIAYAFYLLGLGLILFNQHRVVLAVIVLLANAIPFVMTLGFDQRLAIQTAPFVTFILAYGLWWSFDRVTHLSHTLGASARAIRHSTEYGFWHILNPGTRRKVRFPFVRGKLDTGEAAWHARTRGGE